MEMSTLVALKLALESGGRFVCALNKLNRESLFWASLVVLVACPPSPQGGGCEETVTWIDQGVRMHIVSNLPGSIHSHITAFCVIYSHPSRPLPQLWTRYTTFLTALSSTKSNRRPFVSRDQVCCFVHCIQLELPQFAW